jgi:hypothetical protein
MASGQVEFAYVKCPLQVELNKSPNGPWGAQATEGVVPGILQNLLLKTNPKAKSSKKVKLTAGYTHAQDD